MKASELKKNKTTTVRFNSEVERRLKDMGYRSIQDLLDKSIDSKVIIEMKDPILFDEELGGFDE